MSHFRLHHLITSGKVRLNPLKGGLSVLECKSQKLITNFRWKIHTFSKWVWNHIIIFSHENLMGFWALPLNLHRMFVIILVSLMLKSSSRYSGSQIEFLIYDHDDLSDLHIEIIFLKEIVFQEDFSITLASKKRLKEILKEIGKENEIWKFFWSNSISWSRCVLI